MAERGKGPARAGALVACLLLLLLAAPAARAAEFGIGSFTTTASTTQAGAHADFSTLFALSTDALGNPVGSMKGMRIELPAGLVGNPEAVEKCSFQTLETEGCPAATQIGTFELSTNGGCPGYATPLTATAEVGATELQVESTEGVCAEENGETTIGSGPSAEQVVVSQAPTSHSLKLAAPIQHEHAIGEAVTHVAEPFELPLPLFNLDPLPGHAATFGTDIVGITVIIKVDIGTQGSLVATLEYASTELPLAGGGVSLWGVPADPSHDSQRCTGVSECGVAASGAATAFMTMPTECSGGPLTTVLTLESWKGQEDTGRATEPAPTGCNRLSIEPSLQVRPETTEADTPAGYEIGITMPQRLEPYGLATPPLKNIAVTLPAGTSLSPAFADGLGTCADAQLAASGCPDSSRMGSAEIVSPLLGEPLKGSVYFGTPTADVKYPLLVRVSGGGVTIQFAGRAVPDPHTGQVTTIVENAPRLPFGKLRLSLFGGSTAPLDNPQACGPANSSAAITAYGGATAVSTRSFTVDGSCGTPFDPGFVAGSKVPKAAAYSPFVLAVSRGDGEQELGSLSATLPPGLIGLMRSTRLCPEPQAAAGECGAGSVVGTATVAAGAGSSPLYVSGPAYLTGPYRGAPFGLEVAIHAAAGPIDLGNLIVRSRLYVEPGSLALRIVTDALPRIVNGIPLRLRTVRISLDRPNFMMTPSTCSAHVITGTARSATGARHELSTPFGVVGCNGLHFAPRVSALTGAHGSRRGKGARLRLRIDAGGATRPAIRTASITLPPALRPRLTTIQGSCPQDEESLESLCPSTSIIGNAVARTPVLPEPLVGNAYLVAHGGRREPSLVLLLHGGGITVPLEGALAISRSHVIRAVFDDLPDIPIDSLMLSLPRGPHSMLGSVGRLCGKRPRLSYGLTDQAGASYESVARIKVSGCRRKRGRPMRRNHAQHHRRNHAQHHRRNHAQHHRRNHAQHHRRNPASAAPRLIASFKPNTPGANAAIKLDLAVGSTPSPLVGLALHLPREIATGLNSLGLATCNASRLRARGPRACPRNSLIGRGRGVVRVPIGSEPIREDIAIRLFMAPAVNRQTRVLFYAQATDPVIAQFVFEGSMSGDTAPFGTLLEAGVPEIAGLPGSPPVGLVRLKVELGPRSLRYTKEVNGKTVTYVPEGFVAPSTCPADGYPFAATFDFAGGRRKSVSTRASCAR